VRVTFDGQHLDGVTAVAADLPGVTAVIVPGGRTDTRLSADVTFPATAPAGPHPLRLRSPRGDSNPLPFTLDLFPAVAEREPNDSPGTAQPVTLPAALVGTLGRAGEVDWFRFDAKAGQSVGVQAVIAAGAKLDPVLQLTDLAGRVLAEGGTSLGYTFPAAGTFALGVRDRDYRGGPGTGYRLQVGEVPVVTAAFPLGLPRGGEADIHVRGVFLGGAGTVHVKAPADAAVGSKLPLPLTTPALGAPALVVGEFPERSAESGTAVGPILPVPGTGNGVIDRPGAAQVWPFAAKKGQPLIVEVAARRLGSPLDPAIEILDAAGRPVPRATLRCLSKTYTTFRDHDSTGGGIRLEAWNELAMDDLLYVGGELVRIKDLPKNPDDDCQFYAVASQRVGYLETTPTFHSLGTPMYKVSVHPPGTAFPPNGMPVFTLYYRNDDGGPGYGKDSRLTFDAPADGEYRVRVTDARGEAGPAHAYRVTVRPPRPDFRVSFSPTAPAVWKGGALPVSVTATRLDNFDGPIELKLENLPPGFQAPATTIEAGQTTTAFALFADAATKAPDAKHPPLKLVARAMIEGKEVVRDAAGGLPKVVEPGDLVTTTGQGEVTLRPGHEARLTVTVERRNGFAGRVPLEVQGLPHGVRVLNIGLNGILITEKDSSREVVLYAEPWVKPTAHPVVVLSKREGKNTEHAAKAVLLRVVP
jgi:hypothetical protein